MTLRAACAGTLIAVVLMPLNPSIAAPLKRGQIEGRDVTFRTADGREIAAQVGRSAVPENRSKPNSKLIQVAFVRLKSLGAKPGTPIVFLDGGPGGSATQIAKSPEGLSRVVPVLEQSDLILIDQRGVGESRPNLTWEPDIDLSPDVFLSRESFVKACKQFCARAAAHHRKNGIDLAGYTVVEMADDVNDVRAALAIPKISLVGYSFGTHHALSVIRRHGKFIDRAVLIGTEGPNHTRKLPSTYDRQLDAITKLVAEDELINKDVPDFAALTERVLAKLEDAPLIVRIDKQGDVLDVPVGKFGLQLIMVIDLGDTNDIPVLPRLLHSIDQGDPSILSWFVQKRYAQIRSMSAVFFVCDEASGATAERWQQIRDEAKTSTLDNAMNLAFPEIDPIWGTRDLGDAFRAPITSEVPTLFISGTLDSNTPPFQAEEVARGFKNATLLVVGNAGHEDMLPNPQVQEAMLRFLGGDDVKDVRIELPKPQFIPVNGERPEVSHPSLR